eukprot:8794020-Pyramimonas_sp.AAC.1
MSDSFFTHCMASRSAPLVQFASNNASAIATLNGHSIIRNIPPDVNTNLTAMARHWKMHSNAKSRLILK